MVAPPVSAPPTDAPPTDEGAREPREGSTLHYALLRIDGEPRRRALARLRLGRALTDVLLDVTGPDVARTKVHWWHEELDRLHAGRARHPATVACPELAGSDAARARLLELLGAAASDRLDPARDVAALDETLATVGGLRAALLCDALAPADGWLDAPGTVPGALGTGLARHERLSRLPPLLARRHPVFSAELYARHGLDEAGLLSGVRLARPTDEADVDAGASPPPDDTPPDGADAGREARSALLAEAVGIAEARLSAGLGDGAAGALPAPLRAFATLRLHQLRLWRKRGTDLLRERRSLTPLRKAWTVLRIR